MRLPATLAGLALVLGPATPVAHAAPRIYTLTDTLTHANCVAERPDGSILIGGGARVRRLGPDGALRTVAGTGKAGLSGDGGPATAARIAGCGVAPLPDGGFLLADGRNHRVRAVGADGVIRTLWATGGRYAARVTALADGGFAVATAEPAQAWRVTPGGRGDRIAGIGTPECDRTEPVPATGVVLPNGASFAFAPDGGVLLSADCVLRIAPGGTLTPAAALSYAAPLAALADGAFLATDYGHVRRVAPDGAFATVAGCDGDPCVTGDGPALAVRLASILALTAAPDGGFLLSENDRVARVDSAGNLTTIANVAAVSLSVAGDGGVLLARPDPTSGPAPGLSPGTIVRIDPGGGTSVVAGGGTTAPASGQPATSARLSPSQVQALPDGGFAVFDHATGDIVVVAPDGTITRVIAPESDLYYAVLGFGVLPDGAFARVRSDSLGLRVERLRDDGTWQVLAGGPAEAVAGEPATAVALQGGFAPLADGGFLTLADDGTVLRVGPDGVIQRRTGSDSTYELLKPGPAGGGLAVSANTVARVLPDGTLKHLAGAGDAGFFGSADGAPAAAADLGDTVVTDAAPTADGGVLMAAGSRLLWVAPARTARLAVAITRRSLRLLSGGRIAVRTTRAARLTVTVRRGGAIVSRSTTTIAAGERPAPLPRGLAGGVYSVTVAARSGRARAQAHHRFLLGNALPLRVARGLARDRWPALACRSFGPRRVDCVLDETTEGSNDTFDACGVAALVLGRDGVIRWREYAQSNDACPSHPERLFRLRPRWSTDWREAPPL